MGMKAISGETSNTQQSTQVSGHVHGGRGRVGSWQAINFRVGNKPVSMKLEEAVDIVDGEIVTVVGSESGSGFKGLVLRNDATGMVYNVPTWKYFVPGGTFVLLGLPLSIFIIGLPLVGIGGWLLYKGYQTRSALGVLRSGHPA